MTIKELKDYFKTGYNFSKKTGMTHASFSHWMKSGVIPEGSQFKIERLTNYALKADFVDNRTDQQRAM